MNYAAALSCLAQGYLLQRSGWNGKNMFIFLVPGSKFKVNRAPLNVIFPIGTEIEYRPHIDMRAADGTVGVWSPSHTDMLADDWNTVSVADIATERKAD